MRRAISWIASASLIGSLFFINNPQVNAKAPVDVLQATGPVLFKMNLTKAIPRISANIPYDSGYKGQGSYVVVIDSGVQSDHPFLAGKVALEACFAPVCPNGTTKQIGPGAAKPVHWHGTHVAGIVAGSNATMHGVAPEAKIIAINIFNSSGSTYDDNIIEALTWVDSISSDYNIAAVNMSLGTSQVFKTSCNNYIPALTSIISTDGINYFQDELNKLAKSYPKISFIISGATSKRLNFKKFPKNVIQKIKSSDLKSI